MQTQSPGTPNNIEFLFVTAFYLHKGEAVHENVFARFLEDEKAKDVFWASGDTYFDSPKIFVERTYRYFIPRVNLYRFEVTAVAHNFSGVSLVGMEIEHRWASDSVAHDLDIFKRAANRRFNSEKPSLIPVLFTLVYQVAEFTLRTGQGKHVDIGYTCLGELDTSRISEICIKSNSAARGIS